MSYSIALIGAGHRGKDIYGKFIKNHCPQLKITAVAEPNLYKRKLVAREHQVPSQNQFHSYDKLLSQNKLADALLITTMDHDHYKPVMKGIDSGYKILVEKPIAPNFHEFTDIVNKAFATKADILVAHVLRYTPFYQKLKQLLTDGTIGKIKSIQHIENVGYFHFAHSYVRGNWRNEQVSAPLFLAKSSHDFDLFSWLLDRKSLTVYAQGEQQYFTRENSPEKAGKRCFKCQAESNCPYSARHIYLDKHLPWPQEIIDSMPPRYQRYLGVRFTNLGKCVYQCDNTMPEILTASLNYEDNIQVSFTLTGLSKEMNRTTTIFGTKGELRADFAHSQIRLMPFRGQEKTFEVTKKAGAHGGGDLGLMEHFDGFIKGGNLSKDASTLEESIESHITAFAAEQSRITGKTVEINNLRRQLKY